MMDAIDIQATDHGPEATPKPGKSAGEILKTMLKHRGIRQREAAKLLGAGERRFNRILNGRRNLTNELAKKACRQFKFSSGERHDLFQALRANPPEPSPDEFAIFLRELRIRSGLSMRALAERHGLHQPVLSNYETGRAVPSPKIASGLAVSYKLSAEETARFFRLYGIALRNRLDFVHHVTCPELLSLTEWLASTCGLDDQAVVTTVALPPSELPAEMAESLKSHLQRLQGDKIHVGETDLGAAVTPYCAVRSRTGKYSLIVPVVVQL